MSLELQRFQGLSKTDRGKLRATFVWGQSVHRSAARPSGALHTGVACRCDQPGQAWPLPTGAAAMPPTPRPHAGGLFCVRYRSGSPATSHVIPLQVFQTLNSERWNCNVFGRSRKMKREITCDFCLGSVRSSKRCRAFRCPSHRRRLCRCDQPGQAWPLPTGAAASSVEISEWFPSNVARNSPASISNIEFRTLELQRFRVVSKNDRGKLRATFVWTVTCCSTTRSSTRAR